MKQIGDLVSVRRDMDGIELSIDGDPKISMSPDAIENLVAWLRSEGFLPEHSSERRDMFAAAALHGMLANQHAARDVDDVGHQGIAKAARIVADAMLAALDGREEGEG